MLSIVGYTTEKKMVVGGIYRMSETHGLPLDILLEGIRDRGAIPCWISYCREAKKAGMKHARILTRLEEAIQDIYGPTYAAHVLDVLTGMQEKGNLYL